MKHDLSSRHLQPTDATVPAGRLKTTRLSQIDETTVEWLWPNRIPLGKITLIQGDPSVGKTTLVLDIAARVTTGRPWPDRSDIAPPIGDVFILTAEDGVADTIKPRLRAAGADVDRVVVVEGVATPTPDVTDPVSFDRHLYLLESAIRDAREPRLVLIDPISAYLGAVDSHMNADVRRVLGPVSKLAERLKVAIVGITHLNKSGGTKAMYRGTGSLAFVAASRACYQVSKDPADRTRRLMMEVKNNLGPPMPGLAYRLVGEPPRLEWENGPIEMTADEAIAAEAVPPEPSTLRDDAVRWLVAFLSDGPKPQREVLAAARRAGFSERTLDRSKPLAGVECKPSGFHGAWHWYLADCQRTPSKTQDARISTVANSGTDGTLYPDGG